MCLVVELLRCCRPAFNAVLKFKKVANDILKYLVDMVYYARWKRRCGISLPCFTHLLFVGILFYLGIGIIRTQAPGLLLLLFYFWD